MRVGAIKAELETRGVPTAALLEKAELVEALREARRRAWLLLLIKTRVQL